MHARMKRQDLHSKHAFIEAIKYIPGGVNSPVRAFRSVGMTPFFVERAEGSRIYDMDGTSYIDYIGSWGPLILGHAHPAVLEAIQQTAMRGTSFGAPTQLETDMAKLVCERVPSVDMVRMVNSGTEATMSALRLARGFTGRNKIVKFEGCYHGHADSLLIKAGSGVATLGLPDSPGVPESVAAHTITVPYNDLDAVHMVFEKYGEEIAGIIVEPVAGNMGVVPPIAGFLEGLRAITSKFNSMLIFDEVMTGFRVGIHSAQGLYAVNPDITCLGKVIGGGLPVGAYGGRREIMEQMAPSGPIYQAGTLSGNPLAMAAGYTTLQLLGQPGVYETLERKSARLEQGFIDNAKAKGIACTINRVGSMVCPFFTDQPVTNYETAKTSDVQQFNRYFATMLDRGVSVAPSQFEGMFVSLAHSDDDIEATIEVHRNALAEL
jgi:glutamate-1-semialdehyde 2,1-aminomutase